MNENSVAAFVGSIVTIAIIGEYIFCFSFKPRT